MVIVLISGKAEHGKDTFAVFLKEALEEKGYKVGIYHFAKAVKEEAAEKLGWDGSKDEQGRSLLQKHGQGMREYDPYYWCKKLEEKLTGDEDIILCPDTRYKTEVGYFKIRLDSNYTVVTLRVNRYQNSRPYDNNLTVEQRNHISETDLDDFHFDIRVKYDEGVENVRSMAHSTAGFVMPVKTVKG